MPAATRDGLSEISHNTPRLNPDASERAGRTRGGGGGGVLPWILLVPHQLVFLRGGELHGHADHGHRKEHDQPEGRLDDDRVDGAVAQLVGLDLVCDDQPAGDAWPRSRHPCRAGHGQGRQVPGPGVSTIAAMGAYLSTFATSVPTYLYGTLLAGVYATPAIYAEVRGGVHQHRPGRRLSRRRPAGGDLSARASRRQGGARDEDGPARDPPQEYDPGQRLPLPDPVAAAI